MSFVSLEYLEKADATILDSTFYIKNRAGILSKEMGSATAAATHYNGRQFHGLYGTMAISSIYLDQRCDAEFYVSSTTG